MNNGLVFSTKKGAEFYKEWLKKIRLPERMTSLSRSSQERMTGAGKRWIDSMGFFCSNKEKLKPWTFSVQTCLRRHLSDLTTQTCFAVRLKPSAELH